ncbi:MAG: hypothetical protein QMB78_01220 [Rhodospirillales bacterium]
MAASSELPDVMAEAVHQKYSSAFEAGYADGRCTTVITVYMELSGVDARLNKCRHDRFLTD